MNAFLPLIVNVQNGPGTILSPGDTAVSVKPPAKEEVTSPGQSFAKTFSSVLGDHQDISVILQHLQTLIATESPEEPAAILPLLESLVGADGVEGIVEKLQAYTGPGFSKELLVSVSSSENSPDLSRLFSVQSLVSPDVANGQSDSIKGQEVLLTPAPLAGNEKLAPLTPLQGLQFTSRAGLPENRLQANVVAPHVRVLDAGSTTARNGISLAPEALPKTVGLGPLNSPGLETKVDDTDVTIPQGPSGSTTKELPVGGKLEEVVLRQTVRLSTKENPNGVQQVERVIVGNQPRPTSSLPQVSSPLTQTQQGQPVTPAQTERPVGFVNGNSANQPTVNAIPGNTSVLGDVGGSGLEHGTAVPVEGVGETGMLAKGDRSQIIHETSIKSVSLDFSNGQHLGNGLGQFSNSQSGFQQSQTFSGQGVSMRGLEERVSEFPTPALQRLQMDVQVSENQRVQIDVGVQNRQVYAGLMMDHSVLRNLANQFVPQLENQLADVDLELQEFSAEVSEEPDQEAHRMLNDAQQQGIFRTRQLSEEVVPVTQNRSSRQPELGLHFVA